MCSTTRFAVAERIRSRARSHRTGADHQRPGCAGRRRGAGASAADVLRNCYKPRATTSPWQIQFQGRIDTSLRARFFDIDGDEEARTVRALQRRHRKVARYINAGAWEDFRTDKERLPA